MATEKIKEEEEMDIMSFLNDVRNNYPDAISMASGRPDGKDFRMKEVLRYLLDDLHTGSAEEQEAKETLLGQYNSTKGIIADHLVKYYNNDYNLNIKAEDLVLTVGAQEAMMLCIEVFSKKGVVAFEDPSYVGFSNYAKLTGITAEAIAVDETQTISLKALEEKLIAGQKASKPIRLLYVIPDFQNPTGAVMSYEKRCKLLELAEEYDFHIFEDNAYRIFRYDGENVPTLFELDQHARVIFVESFSKSVFPSIRMAALICKTEAIRKALIELKGYVTVNTSVINQDLLKGVLANNGHSLINFNAAKGESLRLKRDKLVEEIERQRLNVPFELKFRKPLGGFFMLLEFPFVLSNEDVKNAAEHFGIVFCLYSFFTAANEPQPFIRLSFSEIPLDKIEEGVDRLIKYLNHKYDTL